jgi:hypothetical protein
LQIYTKVSKFIKNKHQTSWVTAAARPTAVAHGGKVTANGRVQGVGLAAPYHRGPRRLEVQLS